MKRLASLLLLSCCFAPECLALGEAVDAQAGEAPAPAAGQGQGEPKRLSNELDQFVREALDEGLLTPAGAEEAAEDAEAADPIAEVRRMQPAPFPVEVDCSAPYPLDFSEFREFDRYQQAFTYQETASAARGEAAGDATFELAQAYLSLGLYSEARMVLGATPGPRAMALRQVAKLMEDREPADPGYFRELSNCDEEAGIWLAVALLANDQDEGVQQLSTNLNGFRKLPFLLRADIAVMAIPQLDKRGEKILPVKLIADFTEEQIKSTPQLQFAQAIVDLNHDGPGAEQTIRNFLNDPQFQEDALAALMRHGKPMNGLHEEILLGELMKKFGQSGDDRQLAASLQFALQELGGSSHYQPIMDLAGMPALQNDAAQAEILREFVGALQRDLGSDNRLRNLAAINALVSDPGILKASPERTELYRSGAALAIRFGLASLARELMGWVGADGAVIAQLADLEFQREDYGAVSTWAQTYPDNDHIALLAALGAIREGDTASLRAVEARLTLDPDTVLALIEQDAATGRWIVSDEIYDAAAKLTDSTQAQRAARVFAMRKAARDLAAGPEKLAMASVPVVLKRSDTSAEQVTGGTN